MRHLARFCIVLLVVCFAFECFAGFDIKGYKKDRKNKDLQLYIFGVGDAYGWANIALKEDKKQMLYCQPDDLVLGPEDYLKILDDEVKRLEKKLPAEMPVEPMLLEALQQKFPCR